MAYAHGLEPCSERIGGSSPLSPTMRLPILAYGSLLSPVDTLYITLYIRGMDKLMSLSNARASFPEIVRKVSTTLGRVVITVNGQPKATLVSAEELESLEETAEVLSIPGAKDSIIKGLRQAKKGTGVTLSDLE